MILKDCINFKEIQSRIVWFPGCILLRTKTKIITDYNCENCGDYKKVEERIVNEEGKI